MTKRAIGSDRTRGIPRHCRSIVGAALASIALLAPAQADDWPQFRGPNSGGISREDRPLPTEFSPTDNLRWSAELGDGIGSPVVAAGRAFATAMTDDTTFAVYGFDLTSGERLWKRELAVDPALLPPLTPPNSHASSSPAADAERVYVYQSALGLLALDARTGDTVWVYALPTPYFVFDWGPGNSPVLYGDKLLFHQDDDLNPAIVALDCRSGELLWRTPRNEMLASYSLPVICRNGDRDEIVVAGTGKLIGYDPETGRQRWQARVLLRNLKTTPVSHDGVVYVSLESAGIAGQWIAANDKNMDGRIARDEVPEPFHARFDRGDANDDDFLDGEELDLAFLDPDNLAGARFGEEEQTGRFILAVRGGGEGDVTTSHVLWRIESRAPDGIASPLIVDGRFFVIKSGGLSSCFDCASGDPHWYLERVGGGGTFYASPVFGDDKVYVASEDGHVMVLAAGPELEVLADNDLGESILATPAISEGRILVRTRTKLFCFGGE